MNHKIAALATIGLLMGACSTENDDRELAQAPDVSPDYDDQTLPDPVAQPAPESTRPSDTRTDQYATRSTTDPQNSETLNQDTLTGKAVDDIVGKKLVDTSGEELGDVDTVVVDRNTNEKMLVIGLKGIVGDDAKEVVVPLDQIKKSPDGRQLETRMTKQQLEARPDYDIGDYDQVEDDG
jgi:sporulation protein YlmC with PRC-barrel domain